MMAVSLHEHDIQNALQILCMSDVMTIVDIFNRVIIFKNGPVTSALNGIPLGLSGSSSGVDGSYFT
jgi:hypothetical protein